MKPTLRQDPVLLLSLGAALLLLLLTVAAPLVAPYDPAAGSLDSRLLDPGTAGHLLGTDGQGRDVLSRLIWAARSSLVGGWYRSCWPPCSAPCWASRRASAGG